MSVYSRARRALPARVKTPLRRALKGTLRTVDEHLPDSLSRRVRRAIGRGVPARAPRGAAPAGDPLGLAPGPGPTAAMATVATGRAAAVTARDPEAAHRLNRALLGGRAPRPAGGGRRIAVLAAADLVARLETAGHQTHLLLPGTARATIDLGEVAVIDLAGVAGTWAGALDAEGVALFQELQDALAHARAQGISVWLVDRGPDRFRLGAVALRRDEGILTVRPGAAPPQHHITEDPGDAPTGVVDLLRDLDPLQPAPRPASDAQTNGSQEARR
ncbi:hypothetical protein [Citricoccus sp.]|uniref:hypothetical protein n=1 Tax=Citricoccus sp. TaxID=1978372 RepID=UPI0028BDEDB5|nr:hypothetical protein [Citricoccus sp.]